ncbi:MAG: nucleotidyltransferase family protein [Proteobacteria bacterium]|nr:nucleotidyltransferase family protein [Pseudomonadota bacterium]
MPSPVVLPSREALLACLERELPAAGSDDALFARARFHGVTSLLYTLPEAARRGRCADASAFMQACRRDAVDISMWELAHREELARVLAALHLAGVDALLLKGTPLSFTHYAQAVQRDRGDTDILVPEDRRDVALQVLEREGYRRGVGVSGRFISYQADLVRVDRRGARHHVDLHWRINNSQILAPTLSFAELAAHAIAVPELGPHARAPSPPYALLFAAMHRAGHVDAPYRVGDEAHAGGDRLIWLLDIHLLTAALTAGEQHAFVGLARAKALTAVCSEALAATVRAFGTAVPPALVAGLANAPTPERSAVLLTASAWRHALAELRALPRWRDRAALIGEHLFPPPAYMRERYADGRLRWLPWLYARRLGRAIRRTSPGVPSRWRT